MTASATFLPTTTIALFDMDRTLVTRHTSRLYVRFLRDRGEMNAWNALQVAYWLVQYTLGVVDAEQVAKYLLKDYRGKDSQWLRERCQYWFRTYVQPHISQLGRNRVAEHLSNGHHVAVATSAFRHSAEPLAEALNIPHLICSELEEESKILTGNFCAPLCFGQGKLQRAQQLVEKLGGKLSQVAFYTDSITDVPLLEKVGEPVIINPDFRLRRLAARRNWPVEDWK